MLPAGESLAGGEVSAVTAIVMDAAFILLLAALYAATHWLVWALSRLGGVE